MSKITHKKAKMNQWELLKQSSSGQGKLSRWFGNEYKKYIQIKK